MAYAGNELKGYGNLVLIRHPNGYVTAYAHAKELLVKRGDQVKRGQVIANSGQTGNVDTPQLHFEVRKGPAPLDPMPLLCGGQINYWGLSLFSTSVVAALGVRHSEDTLSRRLKCHS